MSTLTDRTVHILTGLIALVFLASAGVFGVKAATGGLTPVYHLDGRFSAAGQGLIRDSDVKIHGVPIGRVTRVKLVEGRALVTMEIHDDQKIPTDARAVIRPKTLFGEKFVDIDPGPREATGPFLADGGRITHTLGGFELERVLAEAYPILKAIDPAELAVVVDTLAGAARGEGDAINRQIANWTKVARVSAAHDADIRRFLTDLADLSDELAKRAPDVVGGAKDLNAALPVLNSRGDEVAATLDQASRLAADVSDVLESNRPFLDKSVVQGGKTLQLLSDRRARIPALVTGLRQFFQVLSEVAGFPQADGTKLARVKFIAGGGPLCGRTDVGCPLNPPPAPLGSSGASGSAGTGLPLLPGQLELPVLSPGSRSGSAGLVDLIGGLLR